MYWHQKVWQQQIIINDVFDECSSDLTEIIYLFCELNTGRLYGSTRQGINNMKDSTLMLASFEKTTEILYNAAMQGRKDTLEGVSERIIIGQNIPMGTGTFNLLYGTKLNVENKG